MRGEDTTGGLGACPQEWSRRRGGLTASKQSTLEKGPAGAFFLLTARVSGFCVRTAFARGAEYSAPLRASCALEYAFSPDGGSERSEQGGARRPLGRICPRTEPPHRGVPYARARAFSSFLLFFLF